LRKLGGVLSLSFSASLCFFFGLPLLLPFVGFTIFLLLDDLLELFFGFWSSSCASCGLGFKIQTLCLCVVNILIKGEIKKPSVHWFDL
jgi:hypothetical protein